MLNILLVTLDQFRGDCLSSAGHKVVRTPHLDRLARDGVRFARHYSQAAPCSPGRASLYTGMYQMNHRVVANGTPLARGIDNVALAARRAGYRPVLFGYTDQSVDPREATGPGDPRLRSYEGILPGLDAELHLPMTQADDWIAWLRARGHDVPDDSEAVLASEPDRPASDSMSAFVTERFIGWMQQQAGPWFAHLSQLRPHSPYAAAGSFATLHDPRALDLPIAPAANSHPLHAALMRNPHLAAPRDAANIRHLMAQYFGMVSEADAQLGRLLDALSAAGQLENTLIVVTSDHGEMLGDHGLVQKAGWFEQSYHIPCIVRDPRAGAVRGLVIEDFTENVDIMPTLCEAMGLGVPSSCDGVPLTPFLRGTRPPWWRKATHWEWDWRASFIPHGPHSWPWDRRLESMTLAVRRTREAAYVHFGDGSSLAFDLAADPTWRTPLSDPAAILAQAQGLLTWRAQHLDRTLTGLLVEKGGIGRWPVMPPDWGAR